MAAMVEQQKEHLALPGSASRALEEFSSPTKLLNQLPRAAGGGTEASLFKCPEVFPN
jgi:hypothetical protein